MLTYLTLLPIPPFTNSNLPATPLLSFFMAPGTRSTAGGNRKPKKRPEERNHPEPIKEEVGEEEDAVLPSGCVSDIEDFSQEESLRLRRSLLRWYDENKRTLPWRDPPKSGSEEDRAYAVWVSEVMLQQTRVVAVIDYYNRWMERWPTLRHLSDATQEEVNEMWAGLGYYRRARFLLEGAQSLAKTSEFPRTASSLREVRGIGNYTAGAIASIAFNEAVPVVDGNVIRVITRLKSISSNPKESATVKAIWKLAGQAVDPSRPGDFNQAIMELGATLCSVTSPTCSTCPLSDQCQALALSKRFSSMKVTDYPLKVAKPKQKLQFAAVCVVEILSESDLEKIPKFLLVKRPDKGLLAGLWEFPAVLMDKEEHTDEKSRRKAIDIYLKTSFNLDIERRNSFSLVFREDVGEYVHVFSHIRLHMHVELLITSIKETSVFEDCQEKKQAWKCVDEESLQNMGLTSGIRKVYNMTQKFKEKNIQELEHLRRCQRKKKKIKREV